MKQILIFFLSIFILFSCNNKSKSITAVISKYNNKLPIEITFYANNKEIAKQRWNELENRWIIVSGRIPNGIVKIFNKKNNLIYLLNYLNNKREGLQKSFYTNGQLKTEWTCKEGLVEGKNLEYDKTGKLIATTFYKKGKIISAK